jgi:putative ABC transport system permease protein
MQKIKEVEETLLHRIIRKMTCNKQMMLCLLIGLVLAVAMVSSVPVYTNGILQRMFEKDMEAYQLSSGNFPGAYSISNKLYNLEKQEALKAYNIQNENVTKKLYPRLEQPYLSKNITVTNDFINLQSEDEYKTKKRGRNIKVQAMQGFEDHIKLLHGRMPSNKKEGDAYEVLVSEAAVQKLDVVLDKVYVVTDIIDADNTPFKVKVVGVFQNKDKQDLFWPGARTAFTESVFVSWDLFHGDYMKEKGTSLTDVQWYYAVDYHNISIDDLKNMLVILDSQAKFLRLGNGGENIMPSVNIFKKYDERSKLLKTTLWVLQIPILLMIVFYLFMVSQLIIEQEKNEIAVLKSRGASRVQILKGYLLQALILAGISIIIGPFVGLLICNILGASNGFLEFVSRSRLEVALSVKAYLYSVAAVFIFMLTMMIPAVFATKVTIVMHKQKKSRRAGMNIWKKYYFDALLILISLYGLYSYKSRQDILKITGVKGSEIPMDPLLFLISTLFIMGSGLLFLRLYPYIIKGIFVLGRRLWGAVAYSSFLSVSRSDGRDQFIMLFLILTLSIGIFNANAARTINTNVEEKAKYKNGADLAIKSEWENDAPPPSMGPTMGPTSDTKKAVTYVEPPFTPFEKIDGIQNAAKVFRKSNAIAQVGNESVGNVFVMGIESKQFGETAWFRDKLLGTHINKYLNVMANSPTAFLVSSSFKEKFKVKVGDSIYVKWGDNDYLQGIIYAFVDYWPSFNPYDSTYGNENQNLIVANLSYIQAKTRLEPYDIWLKMEPEATTKQVYDYIEKNKLNVTDIKNVKQQIITLKNDPMLQGTNGALTMGFIVTMIICTIGFLIYWILSIQKRTLQFGVLRAMGMKFKDIIGILVCEQIMISGVAIFTGLFTGWLSSKLFIPLLQIVYSSSEQVPPFRITAARGDYFKLYIIIFIMLALCTLTLGRLISKIKIAQAIKLGED